MKQIKYGNRTKPKSKNFVDDMKGGEDDICGAVLDTLNADYLTYISDLVKATKTPSKSKNKTEQRVNQLFQSPKNINNYTFQQEQSFKGIKSRKQSPSEKSVKNSTVPIKNLKKLCRNSGQFQNNHFIQEDRPQPHGRTEKLKNYPTNLMKIQFTREHYNRYPTQEAEPVFTHHRKKYNQTSILCSDQQPNKGQQTQKYNFLSGIDEYLMNLQSSRNIFQNQNRPSRKYHNNHDIRNIQQIMQQNLKLRKKVHKYQQKIEGIQQNLQSHFIQCKTKQKSQKKKINDLIKSLAQAVNKINQQKESIDTMKSLFKMIDRKAKFCIQQEQEDSESEIEDEINDALVKAMRPSRAHSENKFKKKRGLNTLFLERQR